MNWGVFENFKLSRALEFDSGTWSTFSVWTKLASRAITQAQGQLKPLLNWWDNELRDFGGDPSRIEWGTFRPLRVTREEDWSDWLGHLLETSATGTFARALFGHQLRDLVTDFARPTVEREVWTESEDRRGDLLIAWRCGAVSHVEVKIRDTNFDKTYETAWGLAKARGNPTAWVDHVLISEPALLAWQACAERHPEEREVGVLLWRHVAEALRRGLLARETVTWRAWAWTFCGTLEQKLLGLDCHTGTAPMTTSAAQLNAILGQIELLEKGRIR